MPSTGSRMTSNCGRELAMQFEISVERRSTRGLRLVAKVLFAGVVVIRVCFLPTSLAEDLESSPVLYLEALR
jgi:hypothetical protein